MPWKRMFEIGMGKLSYEVNAKFSFLCYNHLYSKGGVRCYLIIEV